MLLHLKIHQILLFQKQTISFQKGFNVITGETGSGKTAILYSLSLILGAKADTSLIQKGKEFAYVEGSFSLQNHPKASALLKEAEIEHDINEPLLIRREIFLNGKNRAFINDQLVTVSLLKSLGKHLIEIVSQNSPQSLFSSMEKRNFLDLFGNLKEKVKHFSKLFKEENLLSQTLEKIFEKKKDHEKNKVFWHEQLQEIEKAKLKKEEEETLLQEHKILSHAETLKEKILSIYDGLYEKENNIISEIRKHKNTLQELSQIDPSLDETFSGMKNVHIELEEIAHVLRDYKEQIASNPYRLSEVETRLSTIYQLKQKYGNSIEEIEKQKILLSHNLNELENINESIEAKKSQVKILQKQTNTICQELSLIRKITAKKFEKSIVEQLKSLNLPFANFHIQITEASRNSYGEDSVDFLFSASNSQKSNSIEKCASAGELSRIMLAIKTLLAKKDPSMSIIFDEIDANIGGQTARLIGEKLQKMGQNKQIICITHFAQVANFANHHILVIKEEKEKKVTSMILPLDKEKKEEEFARMRGEAIIS